MLFLGDRAGGKSWGQILTFDMTFLIIITLLLSAERLQARPLQDALHQCLFRFSPVADEGWRAVQPSPQGPGLTLVPLPSMVSALLTPARLPEKKTKLLTAA